jgi:hypothetical protein
MTARGREDVGARESNTYVSDIIPVLQSHDVPVGMDVVQVGRDAIEAAFAVIHDAFENAETPSPRWGDVAPDEAWVLDTIGEVLVRMVAVNGERPS